MIKLKIIVELFEFLKVKKMVFVIKSFFLVLLGALIVLTQGSVLAPFIYAIF